MAMHMPMARSLSDFRLRYCGGLLASKNRRPALQKRRHTFLVVRRFKTLCQGLGVIGHMLADINTKAFIHQRFHTLVGEG